MKIAYVRVSTVEQNEQRQVVALEKHGIEKWYIEKVSGKDTNRPKLKEMLEFGACPQTLQLLMMPRCACRKKTIMAVL